jgi:hypothetical protein
MAAAPGGGGGGPQALSLGDNPTGAPDADTIRAADVSVLFIGNSHTFMHNMPSLVGAMIRFQQPQRTVCTHWIGVGFLEDVAHNPMYREEIADKPWKVVVLQAQEISMSGRYRYSRKDGIDLAKAARARGATAIYYPEWGLKGVAGDGARQEKVYREMARAADAAVAPVARAWDLALAARPDLPLHSADGNHQSEVGAFLTACVLTGRITNTSPAALAAYPYPGVDEPDRRFLAETAAKALAEEEPAGAEKP